MPGFSFQDSNNAPINGSANVGSIKTVIYEDSAGKYTFGVDDSSNAFKTFKYEPSSGAGAGTAVDYSALAKEFMSLGGVKALLGRLAAIETINTNVGTIETAVGNSSGSLGAALGALDTKVGLVKDKTDLIPTNFQTRLNALDPADTSGGLGQALEQLGTKVGLVKDKTDKLDLANANAQGTLGEALGKLAKTTDLTPLTTAAGKITAIETVVGNSPLAPMLTGLESKVDAIKTQTNPIPANLTARLDALDPAVTTGGLGQALKGIKDKTDKLDLTDATAKGTLGEALSELAKANQLPSNLTERLEVLNLADTDKGLGKVLKGIQDKTDPIPANLTARLDALDPAVTTGGLGQALKGIKDKTDKLDLTDATAKGTLGEALSELAKANQLPDDLTDRLSALNPADTNKGLGKVLKGIQDKTGKIPDDLQGRLDALNLDALDSADDDPGTLGEALEAIQLETGSMSTDLKLLTALLKGQKLDISNEDMLGEYSHDQFI